MAIVRDAGRVVRERGLAIVAVGIVFAGVAALFDSQTEKSYASYAEIEVRTLTSFTPYLGIRPLQPELRPEHWAGRIAGVVARGEVLRDATRRLGNQAPPYELASRTGVASAATEGRVLISVGDIDRRRGERVASAVAASVVAHIKREEVARLDRAVAALRRERRAIRGGRGADFTAQFRRAELDRQLLRMGVVRDVASPASLIGRAESTHKPVFTPYERVPPALLLGLGIGLVGAFLLDALASRPRDPRLLAEAAGLPLLTRLPIRGRKDTADLHLAYEQLRMALRRPDGASPRTVLVTSGEEGEGKSTVAVELARAEAVTGGRACIVECDLRRPVLGERLGVGTPGLAELVAGSATDAEVVHGIGADPPFDLVPAGGAVAGGIPEVLSSPAMRALVAALERDHDLVVLDSPPVMGAPEALGLPDLADAVVVCAWAGRTTTQELESVREALSGLPELPVGLVVTGGAAPGHAGARAEGGYVAAPGTS